MGSAGGSLPDVVPCRGSLSKKPPRHVAPCLWLSLPGRTYIGSPSFASDNFRCKTMISRFQDVGNSPFGLVRFILFYARNCFRVRSDLCGGTLPDFRGLETKTGSPSSDGLPVLSLLGAPAIPCQQPAPQERRDYPSVAFMSGGVIPPPVHAPPSYSFPAPNASGSFVNNPGCGWR